MKRVVATFANKKTCFVLNKTLKDKHGIEPGTIFSLKGKNRNFHSIKGEVVDSVYESKQQSGFITMSADECILFLDVVYDPWTRTHYFRFLADTKFVMIPFKKGKTIKFLKTIFDIKSNTVLGNNESR